MVEVEPDSAGKKLTSVAVLVMTAYGSVSSVWMMRGWYGGLTSLVTLSMGDRGQGCDETSGDDTRMHLGMHLGRVMLVEE